MPKARSIQTLALAILVPSLFSGATFAAEPLLVSGGLSPSKQLAVAVYVDKAATDLEEGEEAVYLIDYKTKRKIGPLEEVDSAGGLWGRTTDNVQANWSPDSQWLAVTYRTGRMMHGLAFYKIAGRRANPVSLPDSSSNPKGKIFDYLTTSNNPGTTFSNWISKNEFVVFDYGLRPKCDSADSDFSKYGLGDFDGELEEVYHLSWNGRWKLKDIRVPKSRIY
ncbi:hypothetical protein BH09VER1_BH09VER1_40670 [soil metagenome]